LKLKGHCLHSEKRRGLSTIVGGLIFVVLLVSGMTLFGAVLDTQKNNGETARIVAAANLEAQQEDFDLNGISQQVGGFLEIRLTNQGQNTAEMFTVVMTNKTDAGEPTRTFDVPSATSFLPVGANSPTDIFSTMNYKMRIPTGSGAEEDYDFKVISSLGTIKSTSITCKEVTGDCGPPIAGPAGPSSLEAQLFLDGPTGINSKISTIVMFVTNNGEVTLTNVRPLFGNPTTGSLCADMWGPNGAAPVIDDVNPCDLDSLVGVTLIPGQSVLFKWDGVILGEIDSEVLFCNQARGVNPDPADVDSLLVCDDLIVIDPTDCGTVVCDGGGGDEDILDEKFITRPEIFITFPGPFGESTEGQPDRALWGANVVNPTDTDMYIHKVTITAFPPASNDNFDVVEPGGFSSHLCYPQDYIPGNGTIPATVGNPDQRRATEAGSWSCPGSNTIMWKDYDNPLFLPAQGVTEFMVKLIGATPVSRQGESVLVDSTVYTTSGAFGKGDYQTSVYDNGLYANIFSTSDWQDPLNLDNYESSRSGIISGAEETFHVVLTDFDTDLGSYINATTRVVVNVPRAFTLVDTDMTETVGFVDIPNANPALADPSIVVHPDKTTQIIATLENHLGDSADEYAVLTFKATAPVVTQPKLMVMYILANGAGVNSVDSIVNSIGPTHEYVLQVVP